MDKLRENNTIIYNTDLIWPDYAFEVRSTGTAGESTLIALGNRRKLNGKDIGVRSGKDTGILGENRGRFMLKSIGASCSGAESAVLLRVIRGGEGEADNGEWAAWSKNDCAGKDWGDEGFDKASLWEDGGGNEVAGDGGLEEIVIPNDGLFIGDTKSLDCGSESNIGLIPGYNSGG